MTNLQIAAWLGFGAAVLISVGIALAADWLIVGVIFACIGGSALGFAMGAFLIKRP